MPVPNYAVAGFGISGRINPIDRFYFQLALFDGNPSHIGSDGKDDNIHGTDFRWHSEEGLFISAKPKNMLKVRKVTSADKTR